MIITKLCSKHILSRSLNKESVERGLSNFANGECLKMHRLHSGKPLKDLIKIDYKIPISFKLIHHFAKSNRICVS